MIPNFTINEHYVTNDPINHTDIAGLYRQPHGLRGTGTNVPYPYQIKYHQMRGDDDDYIYYDTGALAKLNWLTYHPYKNLTPDRYDRWTGTYRNGAGEVISFDEVQHNLAANHSYAYKFIKKWRSTPKSDSFDPNDPGEPILQSDLMSDIIIKPNGEWYWEEVDDFLSNGNFYGEFDASITLGLQGSYDWFSAGFFAHELLGVHSKTGEETDWYYSGKGNRNYTKHYISIPFFSWTQNADTPTNWYVNQDVEITNTFQLEISGFVFKMEFDGDMNYNNTYLGVGYSANFAALLGGHINYFTGFKF